MFALLKKYTENTPNNYVTNEVDVDSSTEATSDLSGGIREFFRIDTDIALRYWPMAAGVPISTARRQRVNLSGGGIRFKLNEPLHVGERVWIEMILPDAQTSQITCLGRVVRLFGTEGGELQAALEFVKLTTKEQDRVVALCFAEQRKLLQKRVRVISTAH